jgi:hypothetical protein
VTLELALRMKALPEAAERLAHWPVHVQQAAIQDALALFRRQHHAARWSPAVFEAKAQQLILAYLIPGLVPQLRLESLRDVSPIVPRVRLKDHGPDVPLWYTDDQGTRRQIQPDWPFTLLHRDEAFDCLLEVDRSTTSLASASGKRDMFLKLRGY